MGARMHDMRAQHAAAAGALLTCGSATPAAGAAPPLLPCLGLGPSPTPAAAGAAAEVPGWCCLAAGPCWCCPVAAALAAPVGGGFVVLVMCANALRPRLPSPASAAACRRGTLTSCLFVCRRPGPRAPSKLFRALPSRSWYGMLSKPRQPTCRRLLLLRLGVVAGCGRRLGHHRRSQACRRQRRRA